MEYQDLAEEILVFIKSQDAEGTYVHDAESLYGVEEIIKDFMRKKEYFASE
tara:strand:+ start:1165 stop:1317 length:153 start_codon:yes stop_codon:yes gene_type:complete